MNFVTTSTLLVAMSAASAFALPQSTPTTFPSDIQQSIQNLQGYILTAINAYAQDAPEQETITDYSSAGRSLDFFLRNTFLPSGPSACPQAGEALPPQATTTDEAIAYMQQAQLALINVSQDAINNDFSQATFDTCDAIRQYGGAARDY